MNIAGKTQNLLFTCLPSSMLTLGQWRKPLLTLSKDIPVILWRRFTLSVLCSTLPLTNFTNQSLRRLLQTWWLFHSVPWKIGLWTGGWTISKWWQTTWDRRWCLRNWYLSWLWCSLLHLCLSKHILLMNYLLLQTVQPHVKLTHSLVQTQRHYLGYLSHLRSGENFLLSSWTSWHTSTTTGSFRRRGWYRGIRCSCPSRQTLSALRRVHPETLRSLCRLLLFLSRRRTSGTSFPLSMLCQYLTRTAACRCVGHTWNTNKIHARPEQSINSQTRFLDPQTNQDHTDLW